jgi:hypothetical protein
MARKLLLETIPNCTEEFKWGVPVYDKGKFYIAAMKTRMHFGMATGNLTQVEISELQGTGKTMRHIKIHSLEEFDKQKLIKLIKLVYQKATCPPDYKSKK